MARKIVWAIMDTTTVQGLFVFAGCGLETTISSNMDDYLLPAGARRAAALSLLRVLLPAASPGPHTAPWPRQRFQATTTGAALPNVDDVPTLLPTTTEQQTARSSSTLIFNMTRI